MKVKFNIHPPSIYQQPTRGLAALGTEKTAANKMEFSLMELALGVGQTDDR